MGRVCALEKQPVHRSAATNYEPAARPSRPVHIITDRPSFQPFGFVVSPLYVCELYAGPPYLTLQRLALYNHRRVLHARPFIHSKLR